MHPGLRWIHGCKWCHYDGFKGAATTQRSRLVSRFCVALFLWSCLCALEVSIGRTGPYMCVSINQGMFIRSAMCVPDSIKWVNSVWRYVSVRKETRGLRRGKKKKKKSHLKQLSELLCQRNQCSVSPSLFTTLFVCFSFSSAACRRCLSVASIAPHLSLFTRDSVWSQCVDKHTRQVRRSSKSNNQVGKLD